jgi:hypothetical protein
MLPRVVQGELLRAEATSVFHLTIGSIGLIKVRCPRVFSFSSCCSRSGWWE